MRCVLCGDSEASRDGYESEQEDRVSLGAGLNLGELHGSSSHVDVNLFETEPDDLVLGVAIKSLSKVTFVLCLLLITQNNDTI